MTDCIKMGRESVLVPGNRLNLFTGFYLSDMVMDFDEISIDYSFIVSALALHRKGLYKNLQLVKASQANSIKTPSRQLSYTMVK